MSTTDTLQARSKRTEAMFKRVAAALGIFVTADGRIGAGHAAALLGYAEGSLRNMRSAGGGPCFFNRPLGGYSKSYRLADLARWVERSREETL